MKNSCLNVVELPTLYFVTNRVDTLKWQMRKLQWNCSIRTENTIKSGRTKISKIRCRRSVQSGISSIVGWVGKLVDNGISVLFCFVQLPSSIEIDNITANEMIKIWQWQQASVYNRVFRSKDLVFAFTPPKA